ncbi:hypothetical protein RM779_24805 [Streptomyces sp. DSM 41886]|uniref:Uncharacterized protein n=1 Tax=Streptomyces johnsoniae TaxID=3075532 RepID=A0ABU2S9Z5_9ACTN|nr:hypothetical protein [Streptomyces sp. DSM 41886]MDT0445793.1 hypothetical protein [Streptomyces sp. DSM 41886]
MSRITRAARETASHCHGPRRGDPADLYPSLTPLSWPEVPALPALAVLAGLLPAVLAPPPLPQPREAVA